MKKFCIIQHSTNGVVDALRIYFDTPAQKKMALKFWADCVNGNQPNTRPKDWAWVWC